MIGNEVRSKLVQVALTKTEYDVLRTHIFDNDIKSISTFMRHLLIKELANEITIAKLRKTINQNENQ